MSAYLQPGPLSRFFARRYMRHVYFPQVDHHITVSDHTAAELQLASHGHRIPRSISIRGMGVDTDLFSPTRRSRKFRNALCARAGAAESVQLLLYAGRLAPEKNLKLLLDTMEQLPHNGFRLLIAGDGPARGDFLSQAAARFPAQVAYLGHERDRDRLADLFANVDAFLHPNPREPFGIAPLEAMAAGAPLVAPNSGGVTAYANSSNAWLVEPRGEAFATAVRQIASDPAGRGSRVAAARATALRFSWPAICAGYYALYRDLWATMARREPERVLASAS
jgi:glycosyltransferase involved in cell wall biosynthesis